MAVEDPVEMERLADALPIERAASRWIVSDDPDEQVERIRPYVELGFDHLVFHAPGPDQARFMTPLRRGVLPRLRGGVRLRRAPWMDRAFPVRGARPAEIRPGDDLAALIAGAWRAAS